MKNKGTKNKSKKKGSENAFGCDLIEHLQNSGQDVPQVLKKCAEFIEEHGIVDGIYRLSGVTSNIQRLRQEFCSEACPDLTKEVYLQDIHCVGSLCKLYFRELPNPLLTYELYSKFTEAVSVQGDHERLVYVQKVVRQLPAPHFRTLEFLTKHLALLATLSTQTNMHTRNLALVWAPNLLRSKDVESPSANGDMAFQEVRIQQSVIEFILNHTEQIFSSDSVLIKPKEGPSLMCGEKYATLPISGQCGPMKLMSLEEAQARSLGPNHPLNKERQRENSLPDASSAGLYHTVIDVSDSKRKLSGKSKRWKSIFNLGRSVDSKGKLSRNGSVFIRAQGGTEKAALRTSRSMESLSSLPADDDRTAAGPVGVFGPEVKSRTLGSDSLCEHEQDWGVKGNKDAGATGGWSSSVNQKGAPGPSAPQKPLPEQLKVFKGDEVSGYKPTSPKNRRMLYSGSSSSSSRPSFPGSFFPLESSPRHQRRAVNISEPFAVSVPLRVSAVISSNSTPCRGHAKDKAATLRPCREASEPGGGVGRSHTFPQLEPRKQEETEEKRAEEPTSDLFRVLPGDSSKEVVPQGQRGKTGELELPSPADAKGGSDAAPSTGNDAHKRPTAAQLEKRSSAAKGLWSDLHQELKITEPDVLDHKPVSSCQSSCEDTKLTTDVKSKRSRSSPSLTLLCRDPPGPPPTGPGSARRQPSEPDILFSLHKNSDVIVDESARSVAPAEVEKEKHKKTPFTLHEPAVCELSPTPPKEARSEEGGRPSTTEGSVSEPSNTDPAQERGNGAAAQKSPVPEAAPRLPASSEDGRKTLELPHLDEDEGCGGTSEELDLVESWEDLSSTKQWVTSPLHSPDVEELLSPFGSVTPQEATVPPAENSPRPRSGSTERVPGTGPQTDPVWTHLQSAPARAGATATQPHTGRGSSTKQKNRFHRQTSCEAAASERREDRSVSRSRPFSLNLDLGQRCIRDISNQQNHQPAEPPSCPRGFQSSPGAVSNGLPSELELFLNDRQAPLRRNSAPVSVTSVRTAFMIKTCQARAVPVVPPKVQYSHIPQSRLDQEPDSAPEPEPEHVKLSPTMSDLQEELENKEPPPRHHTLPAEPEKTTSGPDVPVMRRRHAPSLEVFVDCPRPSRGTLLQRPSFRNRQRPQSLILLSPPFPIMDYPPSGDDGRLLPPIRSINDTSAASEPFRAQDGVSLQNKMSLPKSGQRLETSTSCFYQPQRRSMIFDSRSHRQIE